MAEWRIVDAKWYQIFARAGLERVFKVLMKFDETKGEVRAVDQEWELEWRAGVPSLALSASAFRGQKAEISFGAAYAFREDASYGKVYEYRFNTKELKAPLIEAAQAAGWGWKGVAFGSFRDSRLLTVPILPRRHSSESGNLPCRPRALISCAPD